MNLTKNWSIGKKIAFAMMGVLVISLGVICLLAASKCTKSLKEATRTDMEHMAEACLRMCDVQTQVMKAKLNSDLQFALEQLDRNGERLRADATAPLKSGSYDVPSLYMDGVLLTGNMDLVDRVKEKCNSTCTIFQVLPERWVRVSTNVLKPDGQRAVGTTIESSSPVYQKVMSGEPFFGTNQIVGKWYDTAYYPLRDAQDQIVAVLYVGVPHEQFSALKESIKSFKIGQTGYIFCLNNEGIAAIHPTQEGQSLAGQEFIQKILKEKTGWSEYEWEGQKKLAVYRHLETYDWVIVGTSLESEFIASAIAMRNWLVGLGLGMGLIGLVAAYFLSQGIVRPIQRMIERLKDLAQGEGDLTQRIPCRIENGQVMGDETDQMASWLNRFIGNVEQIIIEVKQGALEVAAAATQVSASAEEISAGMRNQTDKTAQVSAAVQELAATVGEMSQKSGDAAHNAQQAGHNAQEGGHVVAETIQGMNTISEVVKQSATSITELGQRSEQIGQIVSVINDIADQTNLLALNAAIEAARAGEHGRGFAVVADEVRKLAERTTHATQEVSETIKAIQNETHLAVSQMDKGTRSVDQGVELAARAGDSLQEIVNGAQQIQTMIQAIASSTQEQTCATQEIAENIELIASIAMQSAEGTQQAASAATQLSAKAEQLQALVGKFKVSAA